MKFKRTGVRRAAAVAVLAGVVGAVVSGPAQATPIRFAPAFGTDRYSTSALADDDPRQTAFLVSGVDFPDGLSAGAVAGMVDGNVYLTQQHSIPDEVRARIVYASKIVVVGGERSVGPEVMTWLQQNTRASLSRVSGADRYDTSSALSNAWYPTPGVANVVIATGKDYPDALAGSAAAASRKSPLLLVPGDSVPASVGAELTRLKPRAITVLGGSGRVSDQVLAQLRSYTSGTVTRIAGTDRYATADQVSAAFFPSASVATLASGQTFADALSAGAFAGRRGGPLLLTSSECVNEDTNLEIERLGSPALQSFGAADRISEAAQRRTNCQPAGSAPKTYLQDTPYLEGSARYREDHATIGGHFYPRSVAFDTDPRNSDYATWVLNSGYSRFTTLVGVADGNATAITSTVQVFGDEKLLASGTASAGHPVGVDVDVRGVNRLKVVTTTPAASVAPADPLANYLYLGDAAVS